MYMWCLKRQNHLDHNSLKIVIIAVTKACILWECQLFGKNIEWFSISEKSQLLSFKYAAKEPFLQMVYLPLVLLHCHCVISYIAFWPLSGRAFCICRILVFAFTQGGRPTESQSWEYWECKHQQRENQHKAGSYIHDISAQSLDLVFKRTVCRKVPNRCVFTIGG